MLGALEPGFRSLASLKLVVNVVGELRNEKNRCGIARFPCDSTAFLYTYSWAMKWSTIAAQVYISHIANDYIGLYEHWETEIDWEHLHAMSRPTVATAMSTTRLFWGALLFLPFFPKNRENSKMIIVVLEMREEPVYVNTNIKETAMLLIVIIRNCR